MRAQVQPVLGSSFIEHPSLGFAGIVVRVHRVEDDGMSAQGFERERLDAATPRDSSAAQAGESAKLGAAARAEATGQTTSPNRRRQGMARPRRRDAGAVAAVS